MAVDAQPSAARAQAVSMEVLFISVGLVVWVRSVGRRKTACGWLGLRLLFNDDRVAARMKSRVHVGFGYPANGHTRNLLGPLRTVVSHDWVTVGKIRTTTGENSWRNGSLQTDLGFQAKQLHVAGRSLRDDALITAHHRCRADIGPRSR